MKAVYLVSALVLAGLAGCSSDPTGSEVGTLVVETEASGENIPEFSTLNIEGLAPVQILTDGGEEVTIPLPTGDREVGLDVPGTNCTTPDNPRTVEIRDNVANTTVFVTTCS